MEFITDLIGQHLISILGPGALAAAGTTTVVLASGLGARIVELLTSASST